MKKLKKFEKRLITQALFIKPFLRIFTLSTLLNHCAPLSGPPGQDGHWDGKDDYQDGQKNDQDKHQDDQKDH